MWTRFKYFTPGIRIHPSTYAFLFITLANGIGFTFFGWSATVQASILYSLTKVTLGVAVTSLWGIGALIAVILALIGIATRNKYIGYPGSSLGTAVWMFAVILYLTHGLWFQAILTGVQLWWWIYYSGKVHLYHEGHLTDPSEPS